MLSLMRVVCDDQTAECVYHTLCVRGSVLLTHYIFVVIRECLGTYNASQSYWTDESIDNAGRSWTWIVYVSAFSYMFTY